MYSLSCTCFVLLLLLYFNGPCEEGQYHHIPILKETNPALLQMALEKTAAREQQTTS
eukprot:m.308213 g.308213  ORF g.308213 m.308213 type:complete len:57 (-) comp16472_c0_seq36:175-345(-)